MPPLKPFSAPGAPALLAAGCGTAIASVSAVGLFQMERLLGGLWSVAAVLVAGLCCLALARALGRLVTIVPSGAGLLAYLARGFGRPAGLALVLPYLLLTLLLAGAEALIVGALCARLVPVPPLAAAVVFLIATWLVCQAGVRVSYRVQSAATWALVVGMGLLATAALVRAGQQGELQARLLTAPPGVLAFAAGVGQALFLFMGFELITSQVEVASGVPAVRRALVGSVGVLAGFYGLVAAGFSCLPAEVEAGSRALVPQLALAEEHGVGVVVLLAALSLLASFTSFHGALLALSRFCGALATQGILPRPLGRIDPRTLMPRAALACLLLLALAATFVIGLGNLLQPAILAAAVAAALVYAAIAWVRERPPFAEPGRGRLRHWGATGLAGLLAAVAAGVLIDAGPVRGALLGLLALALATALLAALRCRRQTARPASPVRPREEVQHAHG